MSGEPSGPPDTPLSCPSGQPDMEDARIFGVILDSPEGSRIAYLKGDAVVTDEMVAKAGDIPTTRIFRYAARCEQSRCAQFAGGRCGLGEKLAARLDPVVDQLPSCLIRATCRWYHENGAASCLRCPQVVTLVPEEDSPLRDAAALTGGPASAGVTPPP